MDWNHLLGSRWDNKPRHVWEKNKCLGKRERPQDWGTIYKQETSDKRAEVRIREQKWSDWREGKNTILCCLGIWANRENKQFLYPCELLKLVQRWCCSFFVLPDTIPWHISQCSSSLFQPLFHMRIHPQTLHSTPQFSPLQEFPPLSGIQHHLPNSSLIYPASFRNELRIKYWSFCKLDPIILHWGWKFP